MQKRDDATGRVDLQPALISSVSQMLDKHRRRLADS
jgi:hypothetical protein